MSMEQHDLKGRVEILLTDGLGRSKTSRSAGNMIVGTGRSLVAQLFANQLPSMAVEVAIGTSDSPVSAEDTYKEENMFARTGIENMNITMDQLSGRAKLNFSSTFGADSANALLSEAGIVFHDPASLSDPPLETEFILYNRVTFSNIHKQQGDVLTLNWEIIF